MVFQLRCRNCGCEFPISEDKYASEKRELVQQYNSLNKRKTELEKEYAADHDPATKNKILVAKSMITRVQKELSDLKTFRQTIATARENEYLEELKTYLREILPMPEYVRMMETVKARCEAYTTKDMMQKRNDREDTELGSAIAAKITSRINGVE